MGNPDRPIRLPVGRARRTPEPLTPAASELPSCASAPKNAQRRTTSAGSDMTSRRRSQVFGARFKKTPWAALRRNGIAFAVARVRPSHPTARALSAQEPPRHACVLPKSILWSCKPPARPDAIAA